MICETPIRSGPNQGQLARGTTAGYKRHVNAYEAACDDCLEANRVRKSGWKERANPPTPVRRAPDRSRAPRCALCGGAFSDHTVGEWCRPIGIEAL